MTQKQLDQMNAILLGRELSERKEWETVPVKSMEVLIKQARLWYKINTQGFLRKLYKKGILLTEKKDIDRELARMNKKLKEYEAITGVTDGSKLLFLIPKAGR